MEMGNLLFVQLPYAGQEFVHICCNSMYNEVQWCAAIFFLRRQRVMLLKNGGKLYFAELRPIRVTGECRVTAVEVLKSYN